VTSGTILIDAHVHFYSCFNRDKFFDSALSNLKFGAKSLGDRANGGIKCLMFTETARDHYFRQFRSSVDQPNQGFWHFTPTNEGTSLFARNEQGEQLLLIAGRQIATAEGLEVLALGCEREFEDGLEFDAAVEQSLSCGAITTVPWGFGKWWFRRGALLGKFFRSPKAQDVYLGDNGGRMRLMPRPRLFRQAHAKRIWNLPGSDPLPFPEGAEMPGSFGFILSGDLDLNQPTHSLKHLLAAQDSQPQTFGNGEKLIPFLRHQIMMQLRKRGVRNGGDRRDTN